MNIETNDLWRIRKTIGLALQYILCLPQGPQRNFARCALLKTSQWALDCKTKVVTVGEFRSKLNEDFHSMLKGVVEFTHEVQDQQRRFKAVPRTACLNNSASKLKIQHLDNNIPKLILTSPPYPGVHVLYHRWQINGRRETPIPFGIANCLDSKGAAHYTFGDRKSISSYFSHLKKNFTNLGRLVNNDTIIVQMVSFSKPNEHLMPYLDCMNAVGFEELFLPDLANSSDGRIRREVPNRKWYAENKGKISSSKEIVLFHKPK